MGCNNAQHWDEPTAVSGIKIANAFDLLQAIAREPCISWYIESLDLKDPSRHLLRTENQPSFSQAPDDVQSLHRLFKAVMPTDWQRAQEDDEEFALWTKRMTPFLVDVFILNVVPNAVEIALSKSWGRGDIINEANLELLDAMVRRANDPSIKDASLARLAVVKPFIGHGWYSRACLTPLASFLALNSVREFYMGGVNAFSDSLTNIPFPFNPRHEVYGQSLTKIHLNGSAVGPRALDFLLSRTPHLECLHLGLELKPNSYGRRYNIGHLVAIISAHVGGSLKELVISTNALDARTYTVTNMHGFTQLETLELQAEYLCGPEFSAPPATLPSARSDEYFPQVGRRDQEIAAPRFVDLLPSSLKTLKLKFPSINTGYSSTSKIVPSRLSAMLAGFREEHSIRLPRLNEIVFEPPSDLERYQDGNNKLSSAVWSALREAEACGIKWESGTMFQSFRTFNERFGVKDANDDN